MRLRISRFAFLSRNMLVVPLVLAGLVAVAMGPVAAQQSVADLNGNFYPESEFDDFGDHFHAANGSFATALDGSVCFDPDVGGDGFGLLMFFILVFLPRYRDFPFLF